MKLPRIISIIEPDNTGSIKVAEKCGLAYEKDAVFHGIPVKIYALSARDYFSNAKRESRKTMVEAR